ncbi:MAG TPA: hypothetical protein DEQ20_04960 [Desulfobulbaceae bacterium]|nr:MAG: hypothetical protein A2520_03225 [Deltaproteobacteria bacterium RIFOXYD12_FULL_53_23]HCC54261.1 hypothetical protein [Desulfobulbaceae bacterium]
MTAFKNEWDLSMALQVLHSETVDGKVWAEAVKWLFLFGPPAIREMISLASKMATDKFFPELSPFGYTDQGEPLYDIKKLALSLGMSAEETLARIAELEAEHDIQSLYDAPEAHKIQ